MIDIEKLENLPQRMGFIKQIKVTDGGGWYKWSINRSEDHPVNGCYPWSITKRVLTKFYQKNVDEAFSYYCTLVPVYQQKFFWEQFETKRWRYRPWYLDENNCIQNDELEPKYKGPYTIYSEDYQSELRHKVTGHPKHLFKEVYNHKKHVYELCWFSSSWRVKVPLYKATSSDFELFIIQGYKIDCTSKNDPRFQRSYQEKQKAQKKARKLEKINRKEKAYSFLTTKERELKELSKLDVIKRDRHGFDENSFKGEEYHGQKRKKL